VYLVSNDHFPVATFQIKVVKDSLWFEKLAVLPQFNGEGVGTFCMDAIEKFARELKCSKVCMEVYEKSRHAIDFYSHKGYVAAGTVETMRYNELVMEKEIN
jgi:ribosomal-protein-alanine N-acetyltransferase